MKITKVSVPVNKGYNYQIEGKLGMDDLIVEVHKISPPSEFVKRFNCPITVTFKEDAFNQLRDIEDGALFDSMGYAFPYGVGYSARHRANDSLRRFLFSLEANIDLKRIRKQEVKDARTEAARVEIEMKSDVDGDYLRGYLTTRLDNMNETIVRRLAEYNREAERAFEDLLKDSSGNWADIADDQAGNQSLIVDIENMRRKIEDIRLDISIKQQIIREQRAEAFVSKWEEDEWKWTASKDETIEDAEGENVLPESFKHILKSMKESGDLFKGTKHRLLR